MTDKKVRITDFDNVFNGEQSEINASSTKSIALKAAPIAQTISLQNTQPLEATLAPSNQIEEYPQVTGDIQKDDSPAKNDEASSAEQVGPSNADQSAVDDETINSSSAPIVNKQGKKHDAEDKQKNKKSWIKSKTSIKSSKKTLIPGFVISTIAIGITLVVPSEQLTQLVFDPEVMAEQPDFIKNNLHIILTTFLYLVAGIAAYLSFKAKNQGRLFINDSYLLHKKGVLSKGTKILLPEVVAVDIHWTPFSLLKNIGNLEVSSKKGEINLKNCPNPEEVKDLIEHKIHSFREV